MKQENQQPSTDLAGAVSSAAELQPGLQETHQSGEKILEGARNDDQLQQLKDAAGKKPGNGQQADSPESLQQDDSQAGNKITPLLW
jgi:hypothetical protein